jgi:hypothetical protein
MVAPITEVWLEPDDRTLIVVGLRMPSTVLHSIAVDDGPTHVGLLALNAFPLEIARRMAERSEQPLLVLPGLPWRAEVRLQRPLAGRPVVDRGRLEGTTRNVDGGESTSGQAIARLRLEVEAARTPAERRRIRQTIKAIRRNPLKASPLPDTDGAERGEPADRKVDGPG